MHSNPKSPPTHGVRTGGGIGEAIPGREPTSLPDCTHGVGERVPRGPSRQLRVDSRGQVVTRRRSRLRRSFATHAGSARWSAIPRRPGVGEGLGPASFSAPAIRAGVHRRRPFIARLRWRGCALHGTSRKSLISGARTLHITTRIEVAQTRRRARCSFRDSGVARHCGKLRPTKHARHSFPARASRAPPTCGSLVPSRRKPLSETRLNCEDRRGPRTLEEPRWRASATS